MKAGNVIQLGGKSYIKSKVVMLPTEKAENALLLVNNKELRFVKGYFTQEYLKSENRKSFHLYFLSEEEIKDYESWVLINDTTLHKLRGIDDFHGYNAELDGNNYKLQQIIATTDSLGIGYNYGSVEVNNKIVDCNDYLPRPSNEFIQAYCKADGRIEEVLIECEIFDLFDGKFDEKIKVSPDNTITIKPVPDHTEQPYAQVGIKEKIFTLQDMQRAWDAAKYSGIKAFTTWFDKAGY